jgi:hypothetical protein
LPVFPGILNRKVEPVFGAADWSSMHGVLVDLIAVNEVAVLVAVSGVVLQGPIALGVAAPVTTERTVVQIGVRL